jgi:DNA-directed RNA polymerase subunit N (RpoN/RPB10)
MLLPIACFTCGMPLGDMEDLYRYLCAQRIKEVLEERGTVATQAAIDADLHIECGDILDDLGIVYDCCRAHMLGGMVFSDYY